MIFHTSVNKLYSIIFILLSLSTNKKKKSFNKQKIKGPQLCYVFIDFKKVVTMTALAWSCQSKLKTQWVSLKRFIDGHGHNNDILGYEQCVEKRYSFLCVLKCLNKWNGRTKYSLQCLYFVTFVVLIWIERNSKCAKQTIDS